MLSEDLVDVPKANIVETSECFIFYFDSNEDYGDSPNRWWYSEIINLDDE